jgi:predicted MFS family arabinose efflux permease
MTEQAHPDPLSRRERDERLLLLTLFAAAFMVSLDGRVIAPLLPTLAAELHVSLAQAGWLVSAYLLPYGLCQLIYGPLADRFGKLNVCAHAMAAFSIGTGCCALWPSFTTLLTLRALTGAAAAGLIPLTLAYLGDTVPYERRQSTLAALMASSSAASAFGTGAGGAIATLFSWRAVFPILGALAGVVTIGLFVYRGHERSPAAGRGERVGYREVLRGPLLRPLLWLVAAEGFLFSGAFPYLSGMFERRFGLSALQIGLLLGLTGLSQLATARALPWLLRRTTEARLLAGGGSCMGLAYLVSACAQHWLVAALACWMLGAGFVLCHTTLQVRATEACPGARGTAIALFALSLFLGGGVGTLILGASSAALGFTGTFALTGVLLLGFSVITVRVIGRRPDTVATMSG